MQVAGERLPACRPRDDAVAVLLENCGPQRRAPSRPLARRLGTFPRRRGRLQARAPGSADRRNGQRARTGPGCLQRARRHDNAGRALLLQKQRGRSAPARNRRAHLQRGLHRLRVSPQGRLRERLAAEDNRHARLQLVPGVRRNLLPDIPADDRRERLLQVRRAPKNIIRRRLAAPRDQRQGLQAVRGAAGRHPPRRPGTARHACLLLLHRAPSGPLPGGLASEKARRTDLQRLRRAAGNRLPRGPRAHRGGVLPRDPRPRDGGAGRRRDLRRDRQRRQRVKLVCALEQTGHAAGKRWGLHTQMSRAAAPSSASAAAERSPETRWKKHFPLENKPD